MSDLVADAIGLLGEKGLARPRGRIAFQKLALLIQSDRKAASFRFGWGQYGPYSPTLADDMHERLAQSLSREPTPETSAVLDRIALLKGLTEQDDALDLLELLASHFYVQHVMEMRDLRGLTFLLDNPRKSHLIKRLLPDTANDQLLEELNRLLVALQAIVKESVPGIS